VFAPFNPEVPKYFLAGDHHFEINDETINEITPGQVKEMTLKSSLNTKLKFYSGTYNSANIDNQDYEELVKLSLNAVEAGTFEKVVPSMQRRIDINSDFDLLHAFDELNKKYPMAMVSLLSDSTIGTWLGASPELLVSTDKNGIFKTIALAGTQVYNENIPLRNISWTQKEIEEQALVERYIISCFKKIRVREYDEHGPKSVQAGNLIHLKSDFEVDMKEVNYPQLGSVMLKLLHPTSAVCGMPMEPSLKFLQENEAHEREFYAGFLGPVNIDQESHLYVNLRCLKWKGDHILLYAGAGVTIDSLPQQEVEEVEIKMETIKKALGL
jgi:isochorismate synthase